MTREEVLILASSIGKCPEMWAITKEAYVAQLAMCLNFLGIKDPPRIYKALHKCAPWNQANHMLTKEWAVEAYKLFCDIVEENETTRN